MSEEKPSDQEGKRVLRPKRAKSFAEFFPHRPRSLSVSSTEEKSDSENYVKEKPIRKKKSKFASAKPEENLNLSIINEEQRILNSKSETITFPLDGKEYQPSAPVQSEPRREPPDIAKNQFSASDKQRSISIGEPPGS